MRIVDLIYKKRSGLELRSSEIQFLIEAYTKGEIPDYQMAAFLMAVFFNGMNSEETSCLVESMLHSGASLDFGDEICVDKHSTGGVGDKSSIALLPAVVACGVKVPMIAGRGLGHSGGTIDKLESIPGFSCEFSLDNFKNQVLELGGAFMGQTKEIAPADRKMYALRDVTATVESIPLITSSILSKKLAEGISGLVMDVKFGSGAFMRRLEDAERLAKELVQTGHQMGKPIIARLSNMDQPIGRMVGNALEIRESIDVMKGEGPKDLTAQIIELGAEMLLIAQNVETLEEGRHRIGVVLNNGQALSKFGTIVQAQGGDVNVIDKPDLMGRSNRLLAVVAEESGYLNEIDTKALGLAVVEMGGGRSRVSDHIDPTVGMEMQVRLGDKVERGQELCILHLGLLGGERAYELSKSAFSVGENRSEPPPLWGPRIFNEAIR